MSFLDKLPEIIQGGMGVGVSNWHLAKCVASQGQLGVVSGTAIDSVFIRRLQLGDLDGSIRRALSNFPWPEMVKQTLDKFFIEGGKPAEKPFKLIKKQSLDAGRSWSDILMLSNYVEVFLAKEGHDGLVGINYLEKVQLPTLPSIMGAMLAGVNFVLMGAGIPTAIPGVLDRFAAWQSAEIQIQVEDAEIGSNWSHHFDPVQMAENNFLPALERPKFLAIISSDTVAKIMMKKATGRVDGFIVEDHTAGGHNAPPRKRPATPEEAASPVFGPRDEAKLDRIAKLDRPFWLAGSLASREDVLQAQEKGAVGVQVGTAFAFSVDSGILPEYREQALALCRSGEVDVKTDGLASPTGYPFKVITVPGSVSDPATYAERKRVCDLGYLMRTYAREDGTLGYRCSAEPVSAYVRKGGTEEDSQGRKCLCNGLMATIGLGQQRGDAVEAPLFTAGEDMESVYRLQDKFGGSYTAKNVLDDLLGKA
jgi:nitronate monooxygenase